MGIVEFDIVFERPSRAYFPGEAINGQLKIDLDDSKTFKNIKVELFGGADVHWTEQRWGCWNDDKSNTFSLELKQFLMVMEVQDKKQ